MVQPRSSRKAPPPLATAWQMTLPCTRNRAEAVQEQGDDLFAAWPGAPAIIASETVPDDDESWQLDFIFECKPDAEQIDAILALLPGAAREAMILAPVPETDWVTQSQAGLEPLTAGPFHIRHDAAERPRAGFTNFLIPASRAFGTGQHETTRGCLDMLAALARSGHRFGNIADIGTGTGLLAFAALSRWPHAHMLASDIDPVAVDVSAENAAFNHIPLGSGAGEVQLIAAPGVDHALIQGLAPYDLVIANILAGPLIELAAGLAAQVAEGGSLVLAGLLTTQADRVAAAYRRQGLYLAARIDHGDWPTLHLRKRHRFGWRRPIRWRAEDVGEAPGYGSW